MENFVRFECLRCGWSWLPRKETPPQLCPRCRNRYWNRLRTRKAMPVSKWMQENEEKALKELEGSSSSASSQCSMESGQASSLQNGGSTAVGAGNVYDESDNNHRAICLRCDMAWRPRKSTPKQCPFCHSVRWNVPRKVREMTDSDYFKADVIETPEERLARRGLTRAEQKYQYWLEESKYRGVPVEVADDIPLSRQRH